MNRKVICSFPTSNHRIRMHLFSIPKGVSRQTTAHSSPLQSFKNRRPGQAADICSHTHKITAREGNVLISVRRVDGPQRKGEGRRRYCKKGLKGLEMIKKEKSRAQRTHSCGTSSEGLRAVLGTHPFQGLVMWLHSWDWIGSKGGKLGTTSNFFPSSLLPPLQTLCSFVITT